MSAPREFSFRDFPKETAEFFQRLHTKARHQPVFVDLRRVNHVTPDAILALLALIESCADVAGNLPLSPEARQVFKDSRVLDGLVHRWTTAKRDGHVASKIGTVADGALAQELIDFGLGKLGIRAGKMRGTYTCLIECMGNTKNHSGGSDPGAAKPWYAHAYYDSARDTVCFTFVDYGVGIINSLKERGALRQIELAFRRSIAGQGRILRLAFDGHYPSQTGKKHRGLGLKSILGVLREGRIGRLVAVANRAYVDLVAEEIVDLRADFSGTLLYWEVTKSHALP